MNLASAWCFFFSPLAEEHIFLDSFPASLMACGRASGLGTPTSIFPDNKCILLMCSSKISGLDSRFFEVYSYIYVPVI